MQETSDANKLELEMYKCQTKVYKDMHKLAGDVHVVASRVTDLEKGHEEIKATLEVHEVQRRGMHKKHDEKLELILQQISSINTRTDDNTDFIDKVKKYWVRSTFIATGFGTALLSVYWLYGFLEKNGVVIMFEMAK